MEFSVPEELGSRFGLGSGLWRSSMWLNLIGTSVSMSSVVSSGLTTLSGR